MANVIQMDIVAELCRPDIEGPVQLLYKEYFNSITTQICVLGGSREDSADIFQEAILILIDKVKSGHFRGESSIKTFLSGIARNLWLHEMRTRSRRNKREKIFTDDTLPEYTPEYFMSDEGDKKLIKVLEQVGDQCKKILTGFYYENKSMKELLVEFSYENEQVLRNRKSRCMKKLKSLIVTNTSLFNMLKSFLLYEK